MLDGLGDLFAISPLPWLGECLGGQARSRAGPPPLWTLSGDPQDIAQQEARLAGTELPSLLHVMGRLAGVFGRLHGPERYADWVAAIPACQRAEMDTLAHRSGVASECLLRANVLVETCCTALVRLPGPGQDLQVVRTVDFFPAARIGASTVVKRYRRSGKLAMLSVSWPGFVGVVSGLNEAGVSGYILLNHGGRRYPDGMPLASRLRDVLEAAHDLDEAIRRVEADPVSSGHYLLLADRRSAAVVWREGNRLEQARPAEGLLAVDNNPRSVRIGGCSTGRRARRAMAYVRQGGWDVGRLARLIAQRHNNAQAMMLRPAQRELCLATGRSTRRAACGSWWRYHL